MFLTSDNKIKWRTLGWGTLVTAILCGVGIGFLDRPLFMFLRRFDCKFFQILGDLFQAKVWLVVTALIVGCVYIKKSLNSKDNFVKYIKQFNVGKIFADFIEKTKNNYAFFIFCSIFLASLATMLIKVVVGRARPVFFEALDMTGFFPFSIEWAYNSMPSGHTTASFAGLVMLGLLAPRFKWMTWTMATVIGVSRVCVGAHWPTDVILGAFIGMVAADFVKSRLMRRMMS